MTNTYKYIFTQTLHLTYADNNKYMYYKKLKGDWTDHTNLDNLMLNLLHTQMISK